MVLSPLAWLSARQSTYKISAAELWGIGITIVIGGQFISWNVALSAGFGSFFIAFALISFAYVCLCCCLGELTSTLQVPFSGASYCFVRAACGKHWGFLIGVAEALEYVAYTSSTVVVLGSQLTRALGTDPAWEPMWWFVFFLVSVPIHLVSNQFFWRANLFLAVGMALLLVVYFIMGMSTGDVSLAVYAASVNAPEGQQWFKGGVEGFLGALPTVTWFYIGVESLTLANEDLREFKDAYKGMLWCCAALIVTALLTIFASLSNAPGIEALSILPFPLNPVLEAFGMSEQAATAYSVIPTFATAYGFQWGYSRLLNTLGRSGVFPLIIADSVRSQTPVRANLFGSLCSYLIIVLGYASTDLVTLEETLFGLFQIAALIVYVAQLYTYVIMSYQYPTLTREWISPLGVPGAIVTAVIFGLTLIAVLFFGPSGFPVRPVGLLLCWFVPFLGYYYFKGRFIISAGTLEARALFRLFTMKVNKKIRTHKHSYQECTICKEVKCSKCYHKMGKTEQQIRSILRTTTRTTTTTTEESTNDGPFACRRCAPKKKHTTRATRGSDSTMGPPQISLGSISKETEGSEHSRSSFSESRAPYGREKFYEFEDALPEQQHCVVEACGCVQLRCNSYSRDCECGHGIMYHESYEEAQGKRRKRLKHIQRNPTELLALIKRLEDRRSDLDRKIATLRKLLSEAKQQTQAPPESKGDGNELAPPGTPNTQRLADLKVHRVDSALEIAPNMVPPGSVELKHARFAADSQADHGTYSPVGSIEPLVNAVASETLVIEVSPPSPVQTTARLSPKPEAVAASSAVGDPEGSAETPSTPSTTPSQ